MSKFKVGDMVKESSVASGTADMQLDGAVDGFRSFADAGLNNGSSDYMTYVIAHQSANEWEVGRGSVNGSNVLDRGGIDANSNGDTSKVDFSAGTKHVYLARTSAHEELGYYINDGWGYGNNESPQLTDSNAIMAVGRWAWADGYNSVAIGTMAKARGAGHFAISCFDAQYQQNDVAGIGGGGKDGRTQAVMRNLLRETSDATPTEIGGDDVFAPSGYYYQETGIACIAKAFVIGQTPTAAWGNELTAVFRNDASFTLVGQSAGTAISDGALSACSAQFLANANIEVTGIAATNISWAATVWYYEGTRNNSV